MIVMCRMIVNISECIGSCHLNFRRYVVMWGLEVIYERNEKVCTQSYGKEDKGYWRFVRGGHDSAGD